MRDSAQSQPGGAPKSAATDRLHSGGLAVRELRLTGGQLVLVDEADFETLSAVRWHLSGTGSGYASRKQRSGDRWVTVYMHRIIAGALAGQIVDHINGNRWDNRRANLRLCERWQNDANRRALRPDKFKGVHAAHGSSGWEARICHRGTTIHLGTFATEERAARAYDAALVELAAQFARTNFPEGA